MLEILGTVEGDSLQLQGICMKIDEAFLYLISSQPSPHLVIDRKSESSAGDADDVPMVPVGSQPDPEAL